MFKTICWLLVACISCASALYAQLPFCSTSVEPTDCSDAIGCYNPNLPCEVEKRYSRQIIPWSEESPLQLSQGSSTCDPTYYFQITKVADDYRNHLNSERANWNQTDEVAFFLGPNTKSLTFYDEFGSKKGSFLFDSTDFFVGTPVPTGVNWVNIVSEIRWHPTEMAVIYARERFAGGQLLGELVKRSVSFGPLSLGAPQVLFSFSGYTLGNHGNKIAGGDGNDVHAGRFLLSMDDVVTGQRSYAVYDFGQDALVRPVIDTAGAGSYSEVYHDESNIAPALFTLPQTNLDYATVSASGLLILAFYSEKGSVSSNDGARLFDLAGQAVKRQGSGHERLLQSANNHYEVGFFRTSSGAIKECILAKATIDVMSNTVSNGVNNYIGNPADKGDLLAIYWDIAIDGGHVVHQAEYSRVLEWYKVQQSSGQYLPVNSDLSGGQFSLTSTIQTPQTSLFGTFTGLDNYTFRALVGFKAADPDSVPTWIPYIGEIVELSLDASDLVPRRILHHHITDTTSAYQPEAWFSRKGKGFFFKSHDGQNNIGDQDLYFVEVPDRTCKSTRDGIAPTPRLGQIDAPTGSPRLYPNPLLSDDKLFLEVPADVGDYDAVLSLTGTDGRTWRCWSGRVEPGAVLKIALPDLSAGVYVATLCDTAGQIHLRSKLLLGR